MKYHDLDKKLGQFLTEQVPPGSGPEGYDAAMDALSDVLGMYLGGRLAKFGRASYKAKGQDVIDRIAGVAETTAVQLRPHGRPALLGMPRSAPGEFVSPPTDFEDEDGQKGILLSALGALISIDELSWWRMPGWPEAKARMTTEGVEIIVEPDLADGYKGAKWVARLVEGEANN